MPPAGSPPSAQWSQVRQVFSSMSRRDADHRALVASIWQGCKQDMPGLSRDRHRHGHLDREHRQRDDQAQRQRADRERGRDGVGQSGRGDGRGAAFESLPCRATESWSKSFNARANHPRHRAISPVATGNIAAAHASENGEIAARTGTVMPAIPDVQDRASGAGGNAGGIVDLGLGPPVHGDKARGLLDPPAARRGSPGRSPDRSRSGRRRGCSHRARCRRP